MALALVLGFTQCKKDQPTPQTQGVRITLTVDGGNSNSRVNVNPNAPEGYATVTFEDGDVIYVGNNGHYCGYLEYDGTNKSFSGTIDDMGRSTDDYLHFYFMGNKGEKSEPSTVSITDQTLKYPVISYAHSKEFYGSTESYTANLQNYCAIVKFTTNDIPTATAVTVKGMQNTVSVDFGKNNAAESKLDINPYTPGLSGDGDIILHAVSNTERWAILLAQDEVENATVTATGYENGTCTVPEIVNNTYHSTGVSVELASKTINLSEVGDDITIPDGYTVTGTANYVQISIADGAEVTLNNVSINADGTFSNKECAGITCLGDATIILADGTTNTVKGFSATCPGIYVPQNKTLTISGSGSLNASSNGDAAGIGAGHYSACGNITINGGNITATGGYAAGIGAGYYGSCGAITINGGSITATGGEFAAGIGGGYNGSCGAITISSDVTSITATKGENADYSIGKGSCSSCGTVTVCGTVYDGGVSKNPFIYPEPGLQIGSLVYDNDNHPIAVVAYVGNDYTLAIFRYDWTIQIENVPEPISNMNWSTAISSIQSFNEFTGLALRLPTEEEWQKMIVACGGNVDEWGYWNCSGLMSTIIGAGGLPVSPSCDYWTATEEDQSQAKTIGFENLPEGVMGNFWLSDKGNDLFVRPVIQIGGVQPVTPVTADVTWNINYDFSCNPSCISDGIKAEITVGNKGEAYWNNTRLKLKSGETYIPEAIYPSSLTFTSYRGNISKIVIYGSSVSGPIPSGWSYEDSKLTWEGTPAESVTMMSSSSTTDSFDLFSPRKIEFYLEQGNK